MSVNVKNGRGIKHLNTKLNLKHVGENETTDWSIFLAEMIFKSAWYSIFERLKQLRYECKVSYIF